MCTIVVQKCVDSNTGLPLTFGVVERALREVHFAVHLAKAAKQQALAAIKILEQSFPICRAKMRLRVELPATADCSLVRCPRLTPTGATASSAHPRFSRILQLIQLFDSVESNEVGRDGVRVVKGLCKSENFRSLDNQVQCHSTDSRVIFNRYFVMLFNRYFVMQARSASGRLEVIDLSAHGSSALAPQELLQQQLQQVSLAATQKADADAKSAALDGGESAAIASQAAADIQALKPAFSCNTCAGSFADAAEHRAHFKYDRCPLPARRIPPESNLNLPRRSAVCQRL